jgi:hypothetical protein
LCTEDVTTSFTEPNFEAKHFDEITLVGPPWAGDVHWLIDGVRPLRHDEQRMGAQPVEQREKIGIEDERSGDMWSLR